MREFLKSLVALFIIIPIVLCSMKIGAIAISDNAVWEDSVYCPILDAGDESNSDLCFAAVKVKYDYEVNRIYLLFMLEFSNFENEDLCGVIMNFNGMGNIKVLADGTAEYNNDIYFAELDDEIADSNSMNVLLETTVGIKSGIPENVVMKVTVIDTKGIKSNLFSVDVTDESDPFTQEDAEPTGSRKDATSKTKKVRTTKVKTTKTKTKKAKTTKVKTSKSRKTKSSDGEDEYFTDIIEVQSDNITYDDSRRKLVLAFGGAAALIAIAAACASGIKGREERKDKDINSKEHKKDDPKQ